MHWCQRLGEVGEVGNGKGSRVVIFFPAVLALLFVLWSLQGSYRGEEPSIIATDKYTYKPQAHKKGEVSSRMAEIAIDVLLLDCCQTVTRLLLIFGLQKEGNGNDRSYFVVENCLYTHEKCGEMHENVSASSVTGM